MTTESNRKLIDMDDASIVTHWTMHLGVSRDELQSVIDKVGNSVKAVEKELGF
jgi:hypothetical protein